MGERNLDFLVIGAQKCGTTSLWRGLESHPEVRVPSDKERPFFETESGYQQGLERYLATVFPDASPTERLGVVAPQLMAPEAGLLDKVVRRIHRTCPDVKLIALLRDPIDRAISYSRWATRRGVLSQDADQLAERLSRKHGSLSEVPFVRAGMYGAILNRFLEFFPQEQLLVQFSEHLSADPVTVYSAVFEFIGVDPVHDAGSPRLNVGGVRARVSTEGMEELTTELREKVWPHLSDKNVRQGFTWWLKNVWNVEPDAESTEISQALRDDLARIYAEDAELLARIVDVDIPWREKLVVQTRAAGDPGTSTP